MKISLLVISFLFVSNLWAGGFCQRNRQSMYEAFGDPQLRISFANRGGLINGGVCWWHSRLQRSSLYLVRYAPEKPRPNTTQVRAILSALKSMNQVVQIPGYDNFQSFSQDHEATIQGVLERWQIEDGTINMQWLRGISGKSSLPADQLEKKMKDLYQVFRNSPMGVWVMAQMKGITSHAYVIRHMEALPSGFVLEVIDSNAPRVLRYARYQFGDQSLIVEGAADRFVPYVGFQEDFARIRNSLVSFCQANPNAKSLANDEIMGDGSIMLGEIEPNL